MQTITRNLLTGGLRDTVPNTPPYRRNVNAWGTEQGTSLADTAYFLKFPGGF